MHVHLKTDETKAEKRRMFDSIKARVAGDVHGELLCFSLANSLPFYSQTLWPCCSGLLQWNTIMEEEEYWLVYSKAIDQGYLMVGMKKCTCKFIVFKLGSPHGYFLMQALGATLIKGCICNGLENLMTGHISPQCNKECIIP